MKRMLVAAALSLWMVLFAFSPANAVQTTCNNTVLGKVCATVVGDDLTVSVLGTPVINMHLPQNTVTVNVPGPTVTLPRVTVTRPGAPSVVTRTSTVTITVEPSGQNSPRSATIVTTPSAQSTGSQGSAPTRVIQNYPPERTVTTTRTKAFVFSLGILLLGLLLAFLIMAVYYYLGWKGREREDRKFFDAMRQDIQRIKKG